MTWSILLPLLIKYVLPAVAGAAVHHFATKRNIDPSVLNAVEQLSTNKTLRDGVNQLISHIDPSIVASVLNAVPVAGGKPNG